MKTMLIAAVLAMAAACGGTEKDAMNAATDAPVPAPAGIDLSGNYTLNQYASFIGTDPAHPPPDTLMLTGPMALTQSGAKVSGLAFLRNAADTSDPFAYSETRAWSGTVADEDGVTVVRLDDPAGNHMVAVVDANGNLTGPAGENHGACTRGMGWGCDAIRRR